MNKKIIYAALSTVISISAYASAKDSKAPKAKPTEEKRSVASDKPSKLTGAVLHQRIIKMRYCDFYVDQEYKHTYTFHTNGTFTVTETSDDGPYGENAYGDAYGSAYDNAQGKREGKWSLTTNGKYIAVKENGAKNFMTLYFGSKSYYQHRCYSSPNNLP